MSILAFMLERCLVSALAALLALACSDKADMPAAGSGGASGGAAVTTGGSASASGGTATATGGSAQSAGQAGVMAGVSDDDAAIVPQGLTVTALPGGNGVLDLLALTIRRGALNTEMYAALKNDGDMLACAAGVSIELFDKDQQSLANGIGALLSQHLYRLSDGSNALAACVGPGDVAMAAITDLPSDLPIEQLGYAVYRCPYFAFPGTLVDGLSVSALTTVRSSAGTAYTGTVLNGLDVTVSNPAVTVFPLNRVGRPLSAVTTSSVGMELAPTDSWDFETNATDTPGVDAVAYATAELPE